MKFFGDGFALEQWKLLKTEQGQGRFTAGGFYNNIVP